MIDSLTSACSFIQKIDKFEVIREQFFRSMTEIAGFWELEGDISRATGFPKHVLRFILSLFLGYPLGIVYRAVFKSLNHTIQVY
ncbi:hypothetical protein AC249_AIPGENE966 [Exaiptasia diaphana]|nr:hypothetical protein AC249_AIPGENE966 [Exaiptasia diaphana]